LCLLLGYRGRYGAGNEGNLRAIQDRVNEKIQRIRGPIAPLSFQPSGEAPVRDSERWTVALMWGAAGLAVLALVLFLIYGASLGSHLTDLSLGIRDLRFPG
jgi:type VI protein secretion system component VasF